MSREGKDDARIAEAASNWLARRDAGWGDDGREAFARWCAEDPRHQSAVDALEGTWAALDRPRATGRQDLVRVELRRLRRRRFQRRVGMAAALALVAGLAGLVRISAPEPLPWMSSPVVQAPRPAAAASTARVALPDQQMLSDGSMVELAPAGRIEIAFSDHVRRVRLIDGEAHFIVAKDPVRPFVVSVGGVEVRAVGTVFAVRVTPEDVEVVVSEGRVALDQPVTRSVEPERADMRATLTFLDAGERAIVSIPDEPAALATPMPEVMPLSSAQLTERLAWRLPRLEFTDTTLAEAAALFNRHSAIRLNAASPGLANVKVTGLFRADNVEGFVTLLESSFGVRAERRGDQWIILHGAP